VPSDLIGKHCHKYREVLTDVFGDRLYFRADFIGRGDMSRGGLRCADAGRDITAAISCPLVTNPRRQRPDPGMRRGSFKNSRARRGRANEADFSITIVM
jgi:hypothetical protein